MGVTGPVVGDNTDAERDESERQILEAARELVAEHGEGSFRISDLVDRSGRSVGSIYHFFGSREGVLEAVWLAELTAAWAVDADRLQMLAEKASSPADLEEMVVHLARELHDPARSDQLWGKLEVISASRRRPELRRVVERAQQSMTDAYAEVIRTLQRRGVVEGTVDAAALAVFVQAVTLGRIISDLSGTASCGFEAWIDVVRRSFAGSIAPLACAN